MTALSKSQIDLLGNRLKKGFPSEADLRLLDEYRRSFGPAYDFVIQTIRVKLQLEPTGRPAKSTSSIIEKLRRESIRLSQIQDIAGCRVVVGDAVDQDQTIATLSETFEDSKIIDRRINPSHGYRAVHIILTTEAVTVEIQVRSSLQHLWAELSERLADVVDSSIKYGGGEQRVRELLSQTSEHIADLEALEKDLNHASDGATGAQSPIEVQRFQESIARMKDGLAKGFREYISNLKSNQR